MNCAFDKEKLSGYYDGELNAAEKAEVERHIASCSECLRELGELKSAALLVKELPRLRAPRSLSEGITREIQTAGKVHHFARVRRNLLWACAVAAGIFVVLNVAYFARMESPARDAAPAVAKAAPTSIASVPAPAEKPASEPVVQAEESLRRATQDRIAPERESKLAEERRAAPAESRKDERQKNDEAARKVTAEPERPLPAPLAKPTAARGAEAKSADLPAPSAPPPAPKPAGPAPGGTALAGKDDARPAEAAAEKIGGAKLESPAKESDVKAKRLADPPGEAPPAHYTLASTQLSKARPAMEEALRKMGVKIPGSPPAAPKVMSGRPASAESSLTLELTDSQLARLKQELEKSGHSRLVLASPGDPVLAQFGDTGLYRSTRKETASGGAGSVKKAPEAAKGDVPKAEPSKDKAGAVEPKDAEKDGKDLQENFKTVQEGGADKSPEPKHRIILHLLDVPLMPDPQPAPDPVKK